MLSVLSGGRPQPDRRQGRLRERFIGGSLQGVTHWGATGLSEKQSRRGGISGVGGGVTVSFRCGHRQGRHSRLLRPHCPASGLAAHRRLHLRPGAGAGSVGEGWAGATAPRRPRPAEGILAVSVGLGALFRLHLARVTCL